LKMAPLDRSYTTSYQLAIVSIALSCITFELFDVENIETLNVVRSHSPCKFMHDLYITIQVALLVTVKRRVIETPSTGFGQG